MARNRQRFSVGPSSTKASLTNRSSASRPLLFSALATAESRTLRTSARGGRGWRRTACVRASATDLPRMRSTTSRALRGATRTYFACALDCHALTFSPTGRVLDVTPVGPRERELAQLVADHGLADEDRDVLAPVVDGDRVPDHLREDGGRTRPGLDHLLLAGLVHVSMRFMSRASTNGPFLADLLNRSPPGLRVLAALAAADDVLVGALRLGRVR